MRRAVSLLPWRSAAGEAAGALERLLGLAGREGLEPYLRLGAAGTPDHAADAPALLRRAEEALIGGLGAQPLQGAWPRRRPPTRPALRPTS